jgi:Family of unknown function (DUF6011)
VQATESFTLPNGAVRPMTDVELDDFINGANPETTEGVKLARVVNTPTVAASVALDASENDRPSEHAIVDVEAQKRFVLAGNAIFTLRSLKTGKRFTYKVSKAKPNPSFPNQGPTYFVSLLNGPENTSNYQYMGLMQNFGALAWGVRQTRGSRVSAMADSYKGIVWFLGNVANGKPVSNVEVFHAGKCGRCGRTLTVPESIESGIGPECAKKGEF